MKEMIIYSLVIYVLAILSLIAVFLMGNFVLSILLIVVMNIFGYLLVLRKYKKNSKEKVENNINDMLLLYLCKVGGCFGISLVICYMLMCLGVFLTNDILLGGMFILFAIIFKVTPSVKEKVRTVQELYIYSKIH